jgi:hypothetical protein
MSVARPPRLALVASLWSMLGHPAPRRPWSLATRIRAAAEAGFEGIAGMLTPEHRRLADRHGIEHRIGLVITADPDAFAPLLAAQKEAGARRINVQLGAHDTPPAVAVRHWLALERIAEKAGLAVSLETHRGTCTETPEKTREIADRYHRLTRGRLLRLTLDHSHHAVVKHLAPADYAARLLTPSELIRHAWLCHFRPFNGHHVQVPVTRANGTLTPEVREYLGFAGQLLALWKQGPAEADETREADAHGTEPRTLYACPELGPVGGYNLSTLPSAWPDAVRLRAELLTLWKR